MVEHERTHVTPGTEQFTAPGSPDRPVEQAYRNVRRTGLVWVRITIAVLVFVVLLVFIVQNFQAVRISFFGAHLELPLGVALLLAAVCGVLLVMVPSYGRIRRLRKTLRRAADNE